MAFGCRLAKVIYRLRSAQHRVHWTKSGLRQNLTASLSPPLFASKASRWAGLFANERCFKWKKLLKWLMPKDGLLIATTRAIGFGKCQMITLPMILNGLASSPHPPIVSLYGKVTVGIGASQYSAQRTLCLAAIPKVQSYRLEMEQIIVVCVKRHSAANANRRPLRARSKVLYGKNHSRCVLWLTNVLVR